MTDDSPKAPRKPVVLDFRDLEEPPSPLFRDYLAGVGRVSAFYGEHGWDRDALAAAAERTAPFPRPRRAVAEALARQQEQRGAPAAAERAAAIADERVVAIVTGQQAVLFGGPLYVLYKAIAAVKVAEQLEARRGAPVVPVFWVASDDHDFAEVRSTCVLDEAGQIRTLRYEPQREPVGQPASRILLDETVAGLVQDAGRCLPGSPSKDEVLARLSGCYRAGTTLAQAFARWLSMLLPRLVVLDPSDPALKALAAPVVAREILEASPTSRLALEAGEKLLAAGYHQQVPVRPGFYNLFVLADGQRRPLGAQNGDVEVRGTGRRIARDEAARLVEADPAAWSPGVLLRPLVQDFLLPVAAYLGGPAEIAYHAQIGPSYAHFGIPRPLLLPRPSLTLVEPAQARALDSERLSFTELQANPEGIVARWAQEAYPEVEGAFARTREAIERELGAVEQTLGALDPTLKAAAESARGRALHQVETLHEKSIRALKKRDQARADRLRRTRDALFPGGAFQERGLGFVSYLARHGDGLLEDVQRTMDPWARGHQVVWL